MIESNPSGGIWEIDASLRISGPFVGEVTDLELTKGSRDSKKEKGRGSINRNPKGPVASFDKGTDGGVTERNSVSVFGA